MYNGQLVIDVHGHMSTPLHFRAHAYNMIALRSDQGALTIPAEAMAQALGRHLRIMDERNIDIQMISPRPVAMMHWERPFLVERWTRLTNQVIFDQCQLHPKRFVGVAQLPQTQVLNIAGCVAELRRCVHDLGFVGALLNPDPAGDRSAPGMNDEAWFPLYEEAEKLQATLIVHPSFSRDPRLDGIEHSYQYNFLTEETLATLLLERGDVFRRFPRLRIVICHCGGALRRLVATGDVLDANERRVESNLVRASGERPGGSGGAPEPAAEAAAKPDVSANLFFDTCAYDPWFLAAAIRQRGVKQMAFGTEAPGSGTADVNPQTGKAADDLVATIDAIDFLSEGQKLELFHHNPRRIFPLLARSAALR
jgi:predicted TIM-barrel fold metal-dependent hydrolase